MTDLTMTDLTMIGLGAMGSALARAFVGAGHAVTVWNRTAEKTRPTVALGATSAATLAEAVQASMILVICIDNYDITKAMIEHHDAESRLSGRIIVQLSTGTPTSRIWSRASSIAQSKWAMATSMSRQ